MEKEYINNNIYIRKFNIEEFKILKMNKASITLLDYKTGQEIWATRRVFNKLIGSSELPFIIVQDKYKDNNMNWIEILSRF